MLICFIHSYSQYFVSFGLSILFVQYNPFLYQLFALCVHRILNHIRRSHCHTIKVTAHCIGKLVHELFHRLIGIKVLVKPHASDSSSFCSSTRFITRSDMMRCALFLTLGDLRGDRGAWTSCDSDRIMELFAC
eukprot:282733_1